MLQVEVSGPIPSQELERRGLMQSIRVYIYTAVLVRTGGWLVSDPVSDL